MDGTAPNPRARTLEVDRARRLRPALALLIVSVLFTGLLGVQLVESGTSQPAGDWLAVTVSAAAFLVAATFTLTLSTLHVWVEPGASMHEPPTLHVRSLWRHRRATLRSPNRLHLSGVDPGGPRPAWTMSLRDSGGKILLTIRAPWAPPLHDLAALLQSWINVDPDIVGDETTRALLACPPRRTTR